MAEVMSQDRRLLATPPFVVQTTVTDLALVLSRFRNVDAMLEVPIGPSGVMGLTNLSYRMRTRAARLDPSRWPGPYTPHEVQRTALEVLVCTEVQRRLGFLLAEIVRTYGTNGTDLREPFGFDPDRNIVTVTTRYIVNRFDLSKAVVTPISDRAEFELLEITLLSPINLRARIRKIITVPLTVLTLNMPIAMPTVPIDLPATTTAITSVVTAHYAGVAVGVSKRAEQGESERIAGDNAQILADDLSRGDGSSLKLFLSRSNDRNDAPYYKGALGAKIGRDALAAANHFAEENHLKPIHNLPDLMDSEFINTAADRAAADGLKFATRRG